VLATNHARSMQFKCMIGGDFNTEIGRGIRSAEVLEFVNELGIHICNVNEDEYLDRQWTFRSCLGRLRRLDYIMIDIELHCSHAAPTDILNLGSDHRAVQACIQLRRHSPNVKNKRRGKNSKQTDWTRYAELMQNTRSTDATAPQTIFSLENDMMNASECARKLPTQQGPRGRTEAQRLIQMRRQCNDPTYRKQLTKDIWRECRREARVRQAVQTSKILQDFKGLRRLEAIYRQPVTRSSKGGPDLHACSELLANVYRSDLPTEGLPQNESDNVDTVADFSPTEVRRAMSKMSKGRSADRSGILLQMFLYGGDQLIDDLTDLFNKVLSDGCLPATWRESLLVLLHKGGLATDPNNWRPINCVIEHIVQNLRSMHLPSHTRAVGQRTV